MSQRKTSSPDTSASKTASGASGETGGEPGREGRFTIACPDHDIAVLGWEILVGHDTRVRRALTRGFLSSDEVVRADVGERSDLRVEEGAVDPDAFAGLRARNQRGHDGPMSVETGGEIGDLLSEEDKLKRRCESRTGTHRDANLHRRPVCLARNVHKTRLRLDVDVVCRLSLQLLASAAEGWSERTPWISGVRSCLPIARNGAVH